jgi:hypothetical protein
MLYAKTLRSTDKKMTAEGEDDPCEYGDGPNCTVTITAPEEWVETVESYIDASVSIFNNDLPTYIRDVYTGRLGKDFTACVNKVFGAKKVEVTRNGKTFEILGSDALEPQTTKNAPEVDDYSWTQFELGGGGSGPDALGKQYSLPSKTKPGTFALWIFIANDITDTSYISNGKSVSVSATEIKQRTYVHELGNYLSASIANGDGRYFGDPNGIPQDSDPSSKDFDTGANLERCVWGNMRP